MNRFIFAKRVAATALGLAALAAASASHARTDVHLSIGIPAQGVYVQPAPVYVQPEPVYVQPRPVYVQPQPVYIQPQPVYGHPRRGPWGDRDGDGIPNAHDRWDNRHHWNHAHRHGPRGDADRDGVPNRHDRFPGHPYRY
jgi:PXPV repeat (3 copies)